MSERGDRMEVVEVKEFTIGINDCAYGNEEGPPCAQSSNTSRNVRVSTPGKVMPALFTGRALTADH